MVGGTLRTTTNFFLGHRVKTTMSTNMTQVRSILPARLRGARFATIARDPAFRRYFASGDDSATIRGVLKQSYGAAGNVLSVRPLSTASWRALAWSRNTDRSV